MTAVSRPLVHIYCDGACSPNPGWGGWAALLISPSHGKTRELTGGEPDSTNNRMELTGAIMALRALKKPCTVVLHTDSTYVHNGFSKGWVKKWAANGWRTASKGHVQNVDLWKQLAEMVEYHDVEWVWVKGHSTNVEHNRVDALAVAAREALKRGTTISGEDVGG